MLRSVNLWIERMHFVLQFCDTKIAMYIHLVNFKRGQPPPPFQLKSWGLLVPLVSTPLWSIVWSSLILQTNWSTVSGLNLLLHKLSIVVIALIASVLSSRHADYYCLLIIYTDYYYYCASIIVFYVLKFGEWWTVMIITEPPSCPLSRPRGKKLTEAVIQL